MSENESFILEALARYVEGQLGMPVHLSDLPDWSEREAAFDRGDVDAVWICGLPYVWKADRSPAEIELLAAPVMRGERYQDRPVYFSEIVVRTDSPYQRFEDLRGARWAFNEPGSHSGYNLARYRLSQVENPGAFFAQTVMSGSHLASLAAIQEGSIDGSAVDSIVLELYLQDHPEAAAGLRSLETLGPSPIPPLVVRHSLPEDLRRRLRQIIVGMHNQPQGAAVLAGGPVARYASVTDSDYDFIRRADRVASRISL